MIPRREQQQRVAEIYFYVEILGDSGLCSDEMVRGYFLVTILSKAT